MCPSYRCLVIYRWRDRRGGIPDLFIQLVSELASPVSNVEVADTNLVVISAAFHGTTIGAGLLQDSSSNELNMYDARPISNDQGRQHGVTPQNLDTSFYEFDASHRTVVVYPSAKPQVKPDFKPKC